VNNRARLSELTKEEMTGEKNGDRDRNVDGERDEHPHPVAMQNPSAHARVETGLRVNVEKPIRATRQRPQSRPHPALTIKQSG
jgi:hypothetical protein